MNHGVDYSVDKFSGQHEHTTKCKILGEVNLKLSLSFLLLGLAQFTALLMSVCWSWSILMSLQYDLMPDCHIWLTKQSYTCTEQEVINFLFIKHSCFLCHTESGHAMLLVQLIKHIRAYRLV